MDNIYITVEEVATKIQCSIPTIYRYVSKKSIPHIKQGHRLLFISNEIDEWLLSQRVEVERSPRDSLERFKK
ncbi:helix-turn-helix domain-containing protein [Portibacter marinus]|uniref:helix-turn-helix domain-containing protein n=1 Tax=Portibacter marinus TaxID=2898660 RepID=UPI001F2CB743|nr:helix-turn-helix domain-containing protein [Portibacter marinus]